MKIICLEGCSGTGKTAQYHMLNEYYSNRGLNILGVVEKYYEPFKTLVKEWHKVKGPNIPLTEEEVSAFAKARAEVFSKNFSKLEKEVDLILMDRYFYTSAVYQRNYNLSPTHIFQININYGAPIPNLTFLFDCNPKTCFERINKRDSITGDKPSFSTSPEKIAEIREQYLKLMTNRKEVKIVNTNRTILDINKDLIREIDRLF